MAGECIGFVKRLESLDRGELAVLKRNVGNSLGESRGMLGLFYRLVPPHIAGGEHEETYMLVATLYGYDPCTTSGNFGLTMRRVKAVREAPSLRADAVSSVDKRVSVLLDSDFGLINGRPCGGELAYRLRQCVKLAASAEVGVDWGQLLDDLCRWRYVDRRVQKRWARSYYGETEERGEPSVS